MRTAWLYGAHGSNFVRTMIRLEGQRPTVDVVDDQYGQPTWTADVAEQVIALVHSAAAPGFYHATSSGQTTWCGLAREVFPCSAPIRPGCGRYRATRCPGRRAGPPTACWVTTPGPGLA